MNKKTSFFSSSPSSSSPSSPPSSPIVHIATRLDPFDSASKKDTMISALWVNPNPHNIVIEFKKDATESDIMGVVDTVKEEGGELTKIHEPDAKCVRYVAKVSDHIMKILPRLPAIRCIDMNTDPSFFVLNGYSR